MIVVFCVLAMQLLAGSPAYAQADTQIWSEITLSRISSQRLTFGVDIEPKVLVWAPDDVPGWATLDVTPSVEYSRGQWFDMVGELLVGRTHQTSGLDSTEITPRLGMRLHLLSNLRNAVAKEKRPRRRLVLKDLLRVEWRNLNYSTDKPSSSTARVRNRLESQWALTRPNLTDNGVTYLLGDVELFWPLGEPDERYASKERLRAGLGYRPRFAWRFEALYIWDRSRDTLNEGFTTSDNIIDFRVKRVW